MQYTVHTIAGIPVIIAPMAESHSVTIEIIVKAGSVYETKETNGLSHFLEHMFFKGGTRYPTPKSVSETIDSIGGEFNAFTGGDYAGYYVKSAPEHAYLALDVLGDMMVNAAFPIDEVEKEKGVIVQEINMYKDRPDSVVAEARERSYFGDNSFGRTILWPEENIHAFTQADLFAHKHRLYAKNNMTIVIAGKILDETRILHTIEELFAALPAETTASRPTFTQQHPAATREFVEQETNQNHLVYGAPGFPDGHPLEYAGKLLALIMGGTMSSRLFQEVREKRGLCYYIGCSSSSLLDYGILKIRAGLSKEKYEEGVTAIQAELTRASWSIAPDGTIIPSDITAQELAMAQSNMLGRVQMGIETSDEMADFIGANHLLYGTIESLEEILEKYKAVTLEQIHQAAKHLNPSAWYGCTIR